MIERLRGRVAERGDDWMVLEVGPVGLRLLATHATLAALDGSGEVTLLTYLYLRDDVMVLYGFATREERSSFERLITVSGIGPRVAQALLSALSPAALYEAVAQENVDALIRVPGIGRKTAQRVILELKDKLAPPVGVPAAPPGPDHSDLLGLLVGLGYSTAEAQAALRQVPPKEGVSDEDRLRAALRYFNSA